MALPVTFEEETMSHYVVQVNDPPAVYPSRYFPRRFKYKMEAIECAKRAIDAGASFARVEFPAGGELDFRPQKGKTNA